MLFVHDLLLRCQASPTPSPWASEDGLPPPAGRSPKGTPKTSPKSSPKMMKAGSLGNLREKSPTLQVRALPSPSESKKLTLPRTWTDSRLPREAEPKVLDRPSTSELKSKSPRAEKTLLEMELLLSKGDPKPVNRLLPGIERKPSREVSEPMGSRPPSRAGSKQMHSGRTSSKSVSDQSLGHLPNHKAGWLSKLLQGPEFNGSVFRFGTKKRVS